MVRVNFNGENYKLRTREVNGQKQEIYYKDGKAYIREGNELKELRKTKDGIFSKAQYETPEYQFEKRKDAVAYNNKYFEGGNAQIYNYTDLYHATNKTVTINGVTGVVKQDAGSVEDTYRNYTLVQEYSNDQIKRVKVFNISGSLDVSPSSTIISRKNPETGEFEEFTKSVYDENGKTTRYIKNDNGEWVEHLPEDKPNVGI